MLTGKEWGSSVSHLKNKLSFVDGNLPQPDNSYPKVSKSWERCNNMVTGWILRSLGPMTIKSVLHLSSACEIWKDLEDRFGQSSTTQLYSIRLRREWWYHSFLHKDEGFMGWTRLC